MQIQLVAGEITIKSHFILLKSIFVSLFLEWAHALLFNSNQTGSQHTRQPISYFLCKQANRAAPNYSGSLWKCNISYAFQQAFTVIWSSMVDLFTPEVTDRLPGEQ